MATLVAAPPIAPEPDRYSSSAREGATIPNSAQLSNGQTGNGVSTNIVDRGPALGPDLIQIVSVAGATPTVTVAVEGSADGSTWFAVPSAADPVAAPALGTFNITSSTTTRRFIPANVPARYLRLNYTANTNMTLTADVFVF